MIGHVPKISTGKNSNRVFEEKEMCAYSEHLFTPSSVNRILIIM